MDNKDIKLFFEQPMTSAITIDFLDVLPGLKSQDSRLLHGKRAQFSSPTHE